MRHKSLYHSGEYSLNQNSCGCWPGLQPHVVLSNTLISTWHSYTQWDSQDTIYYIFVFNSPNFLTIISWLSVLDLRKWNCWILSWRVWNWLDFLSNYGIKGQLNWKYLIVFDFIIVFWQQLLCIISQQLWYGHITNEITMKNNSISEKIFARRTQTKWQCVEENELSHMESDYMCDRLVRLSNLAQQLLVEVCLDDWTKSYKSLAATLYY